MGRRGLDDRTVKALKPREQVYDVSDAIVPGLGVRVSPRGRKTFVLVARFGDAKNPTRRALGVYGAISLDQARTTARTWLAAVLKGQDPKIQAERDRVASIKREKMTFGAVVVDFERDKLVKERKGADAKREIDLDLMPEWSARPIADISDLDVIAIINRKKRKTTVNGKIRGGLVGARNLLALIKRFFRWVIDQRIYGLTDSPAKNVGASMLGEDAVVSRARTLTDDELFAFWRATGRMPYPVGPAYRLLLLTGLRLREAVDIQRQEIDALVVQAIDKPDGAQSDIPPERAVWVIPKERMKGKNSGKKVARAHAVPMTNEIISLLARLPKFKGQYLFTNTGGRRPVSIGSKIKADLDRRMLLTLRAMARARGQEPDDVTLPHWVNHDLRRTVRSHLSRLKVAEVAREAVLAHARPGIKAVYDHHEYLEEKREALQLWAARLQRIVTKT